MAAAVQNATEEDFAAALEETESPEVRAALIAIRKGKGKEMEK